MTPVIKVKSKGQTTQKKIIAKPKKAQPLASPDKQTIADYERRLRKVGRKRDRTLAAHEAAVDEVFKLVHEAMEAQIPMANISRSVGVSRQWLYKMKDHKNRENGIITKRKSKRG